jgi:hypothetical protein
VWRPDSRTIGPPREFIYLGSGPTQDTPTETRAWNANDESEHNTIVVERSDGLWRVLIHPDQGQTFGSRELAVAHAEQLAFSRVPASTVIVREPAVD